MRRTSRASPHPPPASLTGTRTDTSGFAAAARSGTAYVAVIDRATGVVAATIALDVGAVADAADLAGQISAGLGAFGTAGLAADGRLQLAAASGYALAIGEGDSAIIGSDSAGHSRAHGLSHYFGLNDLLVSDAGDPTRVRVRDDLATDSRLLARSRLDIDAGPPASARLGGAGDNRGAQALAAAFEISVATVARGDLPAGSFRLGDYAAEIVAVRAGAADRAMGAAANDRALADDLAARQAATSGVNLDEELARLVLYQEAYSVSARLIADHQPAVRRALGHRGLRDAAVAARIGDLAQNQRLTAGLTAIQARLREAQVAVSSGKAATRYDQIADRAGELVRVKDARALKSTLADQNERLGQRLQMMDGALGTVADIAARARTAMVQRLDGGFGSDVPLAELVDTLLAEVQSALNTRLDGHHLFAGSRTDVAPVELPAPPPPTADPSLYYRGDPVRLTARVDLGLELPYGVTADAAPFAELIAALGQARAAHLADDRAGLATAMGGLETALDGVIGLRAGVGIAAERVETVAESQRTAILYLDEIVAGIEDTDLAAVLTRIAGDQASLEAGYSVTGRLASLSLVDYLR